MDTIDMLEAIGRDASLRHASAQELATFLEESNASEGLTTAILSGDTVKLCSELGMKRMFIPMISQIYFNTDP
jgi:hypothetical protein